MSEHVVILTIGLLVLGYGYVSQVLSRFNISGPMVYTGLGLLVSPLLLNLSHIEVDAEFVTIIVELALVLVLFSDAALLDLKLLRQSWKIPTRLLLIGLPLTIVAGTFAATLIFPDQPTTYLLLLALLLTPTDAALGKAVVSDPSVPAKIRSSINVESGLNDGIIFPILITVVAMIVSGLTGDSGNSWMGYVFQQVVFGAIVGGVVGYIGAKLTTLSNKYNWMQESYQNLIPIALAILAFYLAEALHGNGFIAAFFAGLYAGNTSHKMREHIEEFAESEGELLVLISFFLFGLAFVPVTFAFINTEVIIYSLLSLTILRMLPVILCLIGAKLDNKKIDFSTMSFIAWFGPRGIASILYVLIVAKEVGGIEGFETIFAVVTVTVLMSIVAHGLSAQPLANLYSKQHK
ncbi:cation:proton antiporter [Vibrio aestuarianus]|uniref:cation:proton antiporter n=1 Tax=Vibrio aestuarianus TaxID=28171 RepID=UPI00237D0911|nr:cation:proton antiporter [Vibrio aestuarianus]MDE1231566.1 cation:proton antiporter [Vibrio aestuarianus]MDE1264406.1 cation:proton antiporter [Vibrio aestuarianus]MDE1296334.1 cation:proton antiporter [Vibrio aestuarianus]MDE1328788.1 cation:proton antiporter [Vibrio aestuarianus]MDE1335762.1 cation:proton antiporter [Vibrio aestuarianus]